jgi:pimeloyl-ACP methyl ester carboxylesterase
MFVHIDGQPFFVNSFGEGGTPLVVHSGWIGTWEDWAPQLEAVSTTRRVVGYDHRGAGRTPGQASEISRARLVDDLLAVLDTLGIDRCVVGGFSSGTQVVLEAVGTAPERFAGMVLMCPGGAAEANSAFLDLLATDFDAAIEGFLDRCLPEAAVEDVTHVRKWAHDVLHQANPDQAVALMRHLLGSPWSLAHPREIEVPTLIVQGDLDPMSPPEYGLTLAASLKEARQVVLPGAGHLLAFTRAEEATAAMLDFLAEVG